MWFVEVNEVGENFLDALDMDGSPVLIQSAGNAGVVVLLAGKAVGIEVLTTC